MYSQDIDELFPDASSVPLGLGINQWEHGSIWLVVEAFLPRSRAIDGFRRILQVAQHF
jgi:hypothetical protein